ncbi:hypothetical protein Plhal710r2_c008g0036771 [Plasmopara halstedii]
MVSQRTFRLASSSLTLLLFSSLLCLHRVCTAQAVPLHRELHIFICGTRKTNSLKTLPASLPS